MGLAVEEPVINDSPDVPDHVRAAARDAFSRREAGAVVADIVFDSLVDADVDGSEGHDGSDGVRRLRFGRASTLVDFEVRRDADGIVTLRVIVGSHPATPLTVRTGNGADEARTDGAGQACVAIEPGLASVVVRPDGQVPVQTAWVTL